MLNNPPKSTAHAPRAVIEHLQISFNSAIPGPKIDNFRATHFMNGDEQIDHTSYWFIDYLSNTPQI